ncbi:MAG: hypothetical protein ACYS8W_13585 [Planctomycetota bacterium]|jgi:hypothetical protein
MKRMMIALALATVMALAFTSCGSSGGGDKIVTGTSTNPPTGTGTGTGTGDPDGVPPGSVLMFMFRFEDADSQTGEAMHCEVHVYTNLHLSVLGMEPQQEAICRETTISQTDYDNLIAKAGLATWQDFMGGGTVPGYIVNIEWHSPPDSPSYSNWEDSGGVPLENTTLMKAFMTVYNSYKQ